MHPPYWRQKRYSDDTRDLSNTATLRDFLEGLRAVIENCVGVLEDCGHLAILMGDYTDREAGFVPLVWHTKRLAFKAGLHQACTEIVHFHHGAGSNQKEYRTSFIPQLHDVVTIFRKVDGRRMSRAA